LLLLLVLLLILVLLLFEPILLVLLPELLTLLVLLPELLVVLLPELLTLLVLLPELLLLPAGLLWVDCLEAAGLPAGLFACADNSILGINNEKTAKINSVFVVKSVFMYFIL